MQDITLNLTQRLTLTPQLKQSIEILALSHDDLQALVQEQTEANPFLELTKPNFSDKLVAGYHDDNKEDIFNLTSAKESYKQDLHKQLHIKKIDTRILAIIQYLIENLDDNGYLEEDLSELLEGLPSSANISLKEMQQALEILQTLDPIGIGARNTKECLILQIKYKMSANKLKKDLYLLAIEICAKFLDLVAKSQFNKLSKLLNKNIDEITQAIKFINTLNIYPVKEDVSQDSDYHITPDFFVKNNNHEWIIELNQDIMPKLSINNVYASSLNSLTADSIDYIKQKMQEANWLIKSLQQRFDTLLKVATLIIREQQSFFEHGSITMRPLVMQELADNLGIHVSTVSRALKSKYLQCPSGIYPLNYFLSSKLKTQVGGYISSKTIISCIEHIIKEESKPLSDEQIADYLKRQGIQVARRTIAKYRSQLGLPCAHIRKQK